MVLLTHLDISFASSCGNVEMYTPMIRKYHLGMFAVYIVLKTVNALS